MKILFGRPRIEICPSVNGVPNGEWIDLDTPKEDTSSLETAEGSDLEAVEDGGEVVDRISLPSSYSFTFELFKKKGEAMPLSDRESRGVVNGEFAIRVTSDVDSEAPGFKMDRCVVKTARRYSPSDTYRKQYTFYALKPANGETIKEVENTLLEFTYVASSKTVTVINHGDLSIDVSDSWITASASDRNITVTVEQNEVKEPRTGYVTITDAVSNVTTELTIEQGRCPDFLILLSGGFLLTASGNRIIIKK